MIIEKILESHTYYMQDDEEKKYSITISNDFKKNGNVQVYDIVDFKTGNSLYKKEANEIIKKFKRIMYV